ncbi:thiamine-phosphate synthase [Sinomonas cellulolyticus]|uniref:Thiamine-phosphate synthase n=1 Tax=Sinomonas cellulolyticus TaxID=2801916 RepID=A0ABS1JZP4_9MICC|nr:MULTISPECIES: thiamine phosphate synthase [Sinomonas]MBL0704825.1 thiamine phosphate synthase [Sinomonas cellulolyticus]GHG47290.1 thiamine-phosphate synthase [Sinomonas sp. KCTC 49339]
MLPADAQLYVCTDARRDRGDFEEFLEAAFSGGVDIIQLRDKQIEAAEELELLEVLRAVAERHGKLWAVNDRADIALLSGAPVFHVGQKDLPLPAARRVIDDSVLVGLSTNAPEQVDAARAQAGATGGRLDYFCTGPLWATPTKPGRTAVGLGLVEYAARREGEARKGGDSFLPWFAIGGIDHSNVGQVVEAGASRVVVVRAVTDADDPADAAARLRAELPAPAEAAGRRDA